MPQDTKVRVKQARDALIKLSSDEFMSREKELGKDYTEQRDKLANYIMKPVGAAMATRELYESGPDLRASLKQNSAAGMFQLGEDKMEDVSSVLRNKGYDMSVSVDVGKGVFEVDTPLEKWRRKNNLKPENSRVGDFINEVTGRDTARSSEFDNMQAYSRYLGDYEQYAGNGIARSGLGAALSWQIKSRLSEEDKNALTDPESTNLLNSSYKLVTDTAAAKIVPNAVRTDRKSAVNFLDQIANQRKSGAIDDAEAVQALRSRFRINDTSLAGRLLLLLGESYDFQVGDRESGTRSNAYRWWQSVSGDAQFQQNPEAVLDTYNAITTATEIRNGRFKIKP